MSGRSRAASGGVVVWFEGARLVAERVIYDGRAGTMTIEGPIHLTEPGNAGTPDEAVLVAARAARIVPADGPASTVTARRPIAPL